MYGSLAVFNSGLLFLALLAFGLLNWFGIPAGNLWDWAIGIGIFEWTILIVTVPWNIYFKAKAVAQTGAESRQRGISIEGSQISYASDVATKALIVAIALHIATAAALYWLAIGGITALGYWSSIGVLLLTLLRPAISTYEYLAARLSAMQEQFTYPRQDIIELLDRFDRLENRATDLNDRIEAEVETQNRRWESDRAELSKINVTIANMQAASQADNLRLSEEIRTAVSQITVDGQFLQHARELIRFFKEA